MNFPFVGEKYLGVLGLIEKAPRCLVHSFGGESMPSEQIKR